MCKTQLSPQNQGTFDNIRLPDEEIQWVGRVQDFPLVSQENRTALLIRWIVCAVLAAALSILYPVWAVRSGNDYNVILSILIVIVFAYVAVLMPLLDRKSLQKAAYCVTNKRVMVFMGDRPAVALNRAELRSRRVPAGGGCVHVLFGAAVDIKPSKYRITTIVPITDSTGNIPTGTIFYNVKEKDLPGDILPLS